MTLTIDGRQFIIKHKHCKWTPLEDQRLRSIVMLYGDRNWAQIAAQIPNRNARQCQERWEYYLSPNVNNSPWTESEDKLLHEKYAEYGTKWSVIARFFNGRTNTNVKNRWLALNRSTKTRIKNTEIKTENNRSKKATISIPFVMPDVRFPHAIPPINSIIGSPIEPSISDSQSPKKLPPILMFTSAMPIDFLQNMPFPITQYPVDSN